MMKKTKIFHGTTDARIHNILLEGLKCKAESSSKIHTSDGEETKAVCLTTSRRYAKLYANRKCNSTSGKPLILTLDIPEYILLNCEETLGGIPMKSSEIYCTLSDLPRDYIRHISATRTMDNENIIKEAMRLNGKR